MMDKSTIEELYEINDQIKTLQARKKDLETDLNLAGNSHLIVGNYEVKWSTAKTFNAGVAAKKLTKAEAELCSKTVIDGPKMKALFPKKYENSRVESANTSVRIELVE